MFPHARPGLLCLVFLAGLQTATAQSMAAIETALAANDVAAAAALIEKRIATFYSTRQPDSINNCIVYAGKAAQQKSGVDAAVKKTEALIEKVKALSPPATTLRQTYLQAAEFYGLAGKNGLAYAANEEALKQTMRMPDRTPTQLSVVEGNLGVYAQRLANIELSERHHRNALHYQRQEVKLDYERLYIVSNSMGGIMWYASKHDSAIHYFNAAVTALEKTEATPLNRYYRTAIVQNNISGLYSLQGKPTQAIQAMRTCIANLKRFLASNPAEPKKSAAITFQFEATDNLAGIYKELGDYRQAHSLLLYSYQQKQKALDAEDPALFISQILLGQIHYAMRDWSTALRYLHGGLKKIETAGDDYLFWQADGCNTLALLHDEQKEPEAAARYYERADSLYEASLQGSYDNIYLEFLNNAALFYAENSQPRKALATAQKGYAYVKKTAGTGSLSHFYQLLNLAEVQLAAGNYREALHYSNKGLDVVNGVIRSSGNLLDSVKTALKKPKALLLKAKAEYKLVAIKDSAHLQPILASLQEGLAILEKRKSILTDAEDISLLIADHTELLEFLKQLTLDLYITTGRQAFADQLLSLHESGLYNRIRSRLDKSDAVRFARLPPGVEQKEKTLKEAMAGALSSAGPHDQNMQTYIRAVDAWNTHLQTLRKSHPDYYRMRYASIFKSITDIQPYLKHTTLVRYFFVGKKLMVLVADDRGKQLYPIETRQLEEDIIALQQAALAETKAAAALHRLYNQLWAPFEGQVRNKKVIIIPDGVLHHLNFELLTPQPINGFGELATKSLLANHTISYQYSFFLLGGKQKPGDAEKNMVVFAPGFSDGMKKNYMAAQKDSVFDQAYLALLPQPATVLLAAQVQQRFGGDAFMNEQSTVPRFKSSAGGHKIIHIGTHAEADNLHPEYSRLIFAKEPQKGDSNSLYLFDIYNCDLTSNLTVLTACESGKPGYHDGEGLVSLAHAFHYAGSESIITGLNKIDEQASARLMDFFYRNLLKGLPKDEALRQAKLSYLASAGGRQLSPAYWAGLVLIGDTAPLHIREQKNRAWIFILLGVVVLGGAVVAFRKARRIKF